MHYHLIMGNQAYSSWSLRGWLLLKAFEIEFSHEVVPLYVPEYDQFLYEYYPAATVPTLRVDDGAEQFTIWDSLAIAEFLHEQHPEAGIWPADVSARAAARSLCAEMHSSYVALRSTMPMNVRRVYQNIKPDVETLRDIDRIEDLWAWVASRWGGAGPYLFGENFCAADAFYAPVASRFRTYGVTLQPASQSYVDALLDHPATVEFYQAGMLERWIMAHNEFGQE
ncbi:MAG: glutathione S-transferase [Gammaproteobacteria bacterium]|nr:glutathione S-transferase [Gammaproteobacteria bacterium]